MRLTVSRGGAVLGGYESGGPGEVRLGRGRENHVILADPTVSRVHAVLFPQGEKVLLVDRSSNGTFVGGKAVEKAALSRGQGFTVGPFQITVEGDEPGWAKETAPAGMGQEPGPGHFHGMVGEGRAMRDLFARLPLLAGSSGIVLILGETGSGKELVARAIHDLSPRAAGPFVALNCGAISPELVESELFGHERGAFTGAVGARRGAFEQAHGGTLFLDEVGEMPLALQPRLLRALETGEVRRVGAQGGSRVEVRVVAATHRDLPAEVEKGGFRADLLYRLFVLPLPIPPLRDRPEDILPLSRHFLAGRCPLSKGAESRLLQHRWPGNVRELKNVLERACILKGGEPVEAADLVFLDHRPAETLPWGKTLEDLERTYFARALEISGGNLRAAARTLGIPKSTFFDRVRKYGLKGGGGEGEE